MADAPSPARFMRHANLVMRVSLHPFGVREGACFARVLSLLLALLLGARPAAGAFCEFLIERDGEAAPAVADAVVYPFGLSAAEPAVTVFDEGGGIVPHAPVWRAPHDPWRLRFAAGGGRRWRVRLDDGASPPVTGATWTARAGVLLETRGLPPGSVETLDDFQRLWALGSPVLGRSEVGRIFHGIHPYGPGTPLLARYDGWLRIETAGRYRFATVTDDASFLLVNDRLVASWGGWHNLAGGERGEHGGDVTLPRGLCKLTLLNAQKDSEFLTGACWQPPGAPRPAPIPAGAFEPVGATRITGVTASVAAQAGAAFGCEMVRHFATDDQCWILVRLRVLAPAGGETRYVWRADDGAAGTGPEWTHLFYTPGVREVTLEVLRDGQVAGRLNRRIRVHPVGLQQHAFDDEAFARLQTAGAMEAGASLPFADLCHAILLADTVQAAPLLTTFGEVALGRLAAFSADQLQPLYRLGYHLQSPAVRRYDAAARCWRAVIACPGAPDDLVARTQLHLAGLLIHTGGGLGEALDLLQACRTAHLGDGDRRLLLIYRGDAAAAAGDRDAAASRYQEAGGTVAADDTAFEVRRAARLERARAYLRMREYEAAESTLRALEWERPLTRMELETGLLLIEVFQQRGELQVALAQARRLGAVAPAGPRQADLLRKTVELCRAMELNEEAEAARLRLEAEFPYSEATALLQAEPPTGHASGGAP